MIFFVQSVWNFFQWEIISPKIFISSDFVNFVNVQTSIHNGPSELITRRWIIRLPTKLRARPFDQAYIFWARSWVNWLCSLRSKFIWILMWNNLHFSESDVCYCFWRRNVFLRVCVIPLIVIVNKGGWRSKTKMPLAFTWRFLMEECNKEFTFILQVSLEGNKGTIWSYERVEKAARVVGRSPWFSKSRVCCLRRETLKSPWVCGSGCFGEKCECLQKMLPRGEIARCRSEIWHRGRHSQFWGWRKVVPVCGVLNLSNSYSTRNPWSKRNRRKGSIN